MLSPNNSAVLHTLLGVFFLLLGVLATFAPWTINWLQPARENAHEQMFCKKGTELEHQNGFLSIYSFDPFGAKHVLYLSLAFFAFELVRQKVSLLPIVSHQGVVFNNDWYNNNGFCMLPL
jgi:hypothetical protein